jgi:uncharacterized protein with PIN domain
MEKRFIVDSTVGKLAKWMRSLGFDTTVFHGTDLHRLIQVASTEKRIILTRNRKLETKTFLGNIVVLIEDQPELQVLSVLRSRKLAVDPRRVLSRCLLCNEPLVSIGESEAEGRVPEFVLHSQRTFHWCRACGRTYWEGTHPRNMKKRIDEILAAAQAGLPKSLRSGG